LAALGLRGGETDPPCQGQRGHGSVVLGVALEEVGQGCPLQLLFCLFCQVRIWSSGQHESIVYPPTLSVPSAMTQRMEEGAERSTKQLVLRSWCVADRVKINSTLGSREARAGRNVPREVPTSWTNCTEPR